MPGSMAWFDYIADDGVTYAIHMDESNAAAVGATPLTLATAPQLPKGWEPRHLNAQHAATGAKRKIVVTDPASAYWTGANTTVALLNYAAVPPASATFDITSWIGEKRMRNPHVADTGLLTG